MNKQAALSIAHQADTVGKIVNAMTVDVEDYYHANALEGYFQRTKWPTLERRVDGNTRRILDLFDEHGVKGTFFILGCVAEEFPLLAKEIARRGHEVASHGYEHRKANTQTPAEFRADVSRAKKCIEDITGVHVAGYRAASFSISHLNWWAFDILHETGHAYSSSTSVKGNGVLQMPPERRYPFKPCGNDFVELPITSYRACGLTFPAGGGGYFRLLPYALYKFAANAVNRRELKPAVFYFHPWEIDPGQPRADVNKLTRFRHYVNLQVMERKVEHALHDFRWGRMDEVFGGFLPVWSRD